MSPGNYGSGLCALPGFDESLRLLVVRERYSYADIGMMFGVSHQNVDQWCKARRIPHPDPSGSRGNYAERVWDDGANRFRPVKRTLLRAARKAALRQDRSVRRERFWAARRARLTAGAAAIRERLGRAPTWQELASELGLPVNRSSVVYLIHFWGGKQKSAKQRLSEICAVTGIPHIGVGKKHRRRASAALPASDVRNRPGARLGVGTADQER